MQRLIITGPRAAQFEEVARPDCRPDGLVVQARLTAVSPGTEIRVYRAIPVDEAGKFLHERVPFALPAENGYSMVGSVVEVGRDVVGFAVGDRVFTPSPHKQFAAIAASLTIKLPDAVPDEQAVFLNILEVGHIAVRRGRPTLGENVAIIGQGVIGLSALAYCRMYGFRTVVVDPDERRLAIARNMGADLAVSPTEAGFVPRIMEFFDDEGADLVLEAASNWSAIQTSLELAGNEAKVVIVSRHTDAPEFNPVGHPYLGKKLTLLTSYGHEQPAQRWDRRHSFALTVDRMARRQIDVAPFITHRFSWDQLPDVYRRFDEGDRDLVGVVIRWP